MTAPYEAPVGDPRAPVCSVCANERVQVRKGGKPLLNLCKTCDARALRQMKESHK